MIAHVNGVVTEKFENSIIIDVHGVGYEVQVAAGDYELASLQQEFKLYTHHHIREQSQDLFGFSSLAAKRLFELLISVQGVGPKAALAILSLSAADQVRSAIANGDVTFIQKASGVGKRTAERVVVDLKDKVGLPTTGYAIVKPTQATAPQGDDALDALIALGYSLGQATEALEGIDVELDSQTRIKKALAKVML
ncbi:Holliday junction branch migration protein RuvA [Candidatus Saccharibacteria bacterium]|nr:MAG: Holliday junction branch migration protein RuvA [Candidatus Saccharibacteria bacterium]